MFEKDRVNINVKYSNGIKNAPSKWYRSGKVGQS